DLQNNSANHNPHSAISSPLRLEFRAVAFSQSSDLTFSIGHHDLPAVVVRQHLPVAPPFERDADGHFARQLVLHAAPDVSEEKLPVTESDVRTRLRRVEDDETPVGRPGGFEQPPPARQVGRRLEAFDRAQVADLVTRPRLDVRDKELLEIT